MKKIVILASVLCIMFFTACEQEDIRSSDEVELIDPEFTEGDGDESDGGVKNQ